MRAPAKFSLYMLFCLATALAVGAEIYFEENFSDDYFEFEWTYSEYPGKEFGNNEGKNLVIQYTVKHEQGIDCGGGYIKLFNCDLEPKEMHGETPYEIMFGDEAFGLSTNVLRPYAGKYLQDIKRTFNYRLSRARRYVECSFGILSNKWRIFHRPIDVNVEFAIDIVKCCCVLHNFVRDRDGFKFDDTLTITGMEDLDYDNNLYANRSVNRYRDALANYFVSEDGQISWQNEKI
ncbi:hypothetical protein AGLY_008849 [Aphis glycines]|uniref:DDE Tnp4 domain-containing protein n=1 Tax=Aphis glycines TaxID=307491 RepID=A0A6G0TJS1_APHGL|nr:hypothetical protein AGLY_008849 [Aphis glycines]